MTPDLKTSPPRLRWQIAVLLSAVWLGFVAGIVVGGRFFVPAGSGMAGPAIALGYGLLGLLLALVVATILAWKAPTGVLRATGLVGGILSLLLIAGVVVGIVRGQADHKQKYGMDEPLPPASDLRLEATQDETVPMHQFRELEIDGETWTVRWVAVGPEAASLSAVLTAREVEALQAALDGAEARLAESSEVCPRAGDAAPHVYRWRRAGESRWRVVEADETCLQRESALGELRHRLGRLPMDAVTRGAVRREGG